MVPLPLVQILAERSQEFVDILSDENGLFNYQRVLGDITVKAESDNFIFLDVLRRAFNTCTMHPSYKMLEFSRQS